LGDKTPRYFMIVPQLAALYPDAKFIHLIRDGRRRYFIYRSRLQSLLSEKF
jgi:hypothetical protein